MSRSHNQFANRFKRIAEELQADSSFADCRDPAGFPTEEEAAAIMGHNFLGIPAVESIFGALSPEQRQALAVIPYRRQTLMDEACMSVLVADIGCSLRDQMQKFGKFPDGLFAEVINQSKRFLSEGFAIRIEGVRWRLMRKIHYFESLYRNWEEQRALDCFEPHRNGFPINGIPSARQVTYAAVMKFLASGEPILHCQYVRTSDIDSRGKNVLVSGFNNYNAGGIHVCTCSVDSRGDHGIISTRLVA